MLGLAVVLLTSGAAWAIHKEEIAKLIQMLSAPNAAERAKAAWRLGHMDMFPETKAALPVLVERTKDEDMLVRSRAIEALGHLGRDNKPALDALIAALKDPELEVRAAAAAALGTLGPTAAATGGSPQGS
jgi:HEAT repeat protein